MTHPDARALGAYADRALPPAEAAAVTQHLVQCEACRERVAGLERAIAAVGELGIVPIPPRRAAAMRRTLEDAPIGVERPRKRRLAAVVLAAAVVVCAVAGVLAVRHESRLVFLQATGAPLAFEELALVEHAALRDGSAPLDIASADAPEVRRFLASHGQLVSLRPVGAEDRIALRGARLLPGRTAAAVSYRIDGQPVTLVVTHGANVPEAPIWNALGKAVSTRRGAGPTLLTWRNSGNAYTLVSELPGAGEKACFICHADPGRRRVIERAARAAVFVPPTETNPS